LSSSTPTLMMEELSSTGNPSTTRPSEHSATATLALSTHHQWTATSEWASTTTQRLVP
jgi:hypothetical protein